MGMTTMSRPSMSRHRVRGTTTMIPWKKIPSTTSKVASMDVDEQLAESREMALDLYKDEYVRSKNDDVVRKYSQRVQQMTADR
jgi:hypothetical protein